MTRPTLHPEWRSAWFHARNLWQQRRQLWPQTLFFGLLTALAVIAVLLWFRQWLLADLEAIWRYWQARSIALALVVFVLSWLTTRMTLQRAQVQALTGTFAALPTTAAATKAWLWKLVWQHWTRQVLLLLIAVWLLHSATVDVSLQATLFGSALLAISVGSVSARWRLRPPTLAEAARQHTPRPIGRVWQWLSHSELPNVPAFQMQFGQKLWWAGRARWGLFVLLLVSPRDLLSVLIPIIGMAIWYGFSQLEAMHRSLFVLHDLLAWCPVPGRRVLSAAWRAPAVLFAGLLALISAVLLLLRAPWPMVVAVALLLVALAVLDLLWCVRFRQSPVRAQRVRMVSVVLVLVVLQQWPIGVLPLLLWLVWRATRGLQS